MQKNFIKTKDKDTRDLLIKEGFQLLSESQGVYTFLNDAHLRFSASGKTVTYTNILNFPSN